MRDGCYFEAAKNTQNPELCEVISSLEIQNMCFALTKGETSYCGMLESDYSQFQCYSSLAEMKKDASICDAVKAVGWKHACISGAE
ncbi:MAG TPA: hypothetical protein ENN13_05560 [Candidatus Altiarchaeales archaeon]|nr:hypothetical protein [Candidatus Altiarchaeales archaeon]